MTGLGEFYCICFDEAVNYSYLVEDIEEEEEEEGEEGNVSFNDTLNTFYLRLYGVRHMVKDHSDSERGRKEGNDSFNDTLNTFYLRLYGVRHMVKDHSDSERGLTYHGLCYTSRAMNERSYYGATSRSHI